MTTTAGSPRGNPERTVARWIEQESTSPRQVVAREIEYARAAVAAVVSGMPVRRRGDLLHVWAGGRWHAMAPVPDRATTPARTGPASRSFAWVHFDLDRHDWFAVGRSPGAAPPTGSGWRAVRWLATAA